MSEPRFTVGRAADCDVVVADDSVSRRHAELTFLSGGRLMVVDCHSTGGTALVLGSKHRPITQEWVAPDATLQFGDVLMPVPQLLEALRRKHPGFEPGALLPPVDAPAETPPWGNPGVRLVRCACGALKLKDGACSSCGA